MKRVYVCFLVLFLGMAWWARSGGAAPAGKLVMGVASEPTTFDPHVCMAN